MSYDPYNKLRAECLRRGYDPGFMIRLARLLEERQTHVIKKEIPRKYKLRKGVKGVEGYVDGRKVFDFASAKIAAETLGLCRSSITSCCTGYKGYQSAGMHNGKKIVWKYKEVKDED